MATSRDRLKEAQERYDFMYNGNKKFRKKAKKAFGYVVGGKYQWNTADREKLVRDKRPWLSINNVAPKINLMVGLERQNRTGAVGVGVGGEDDPMGLLITGLLKFINRNRIVDYVNARVWKTGISCGRGWAEVGTEKDLDFQRINKIRAESPFSCMKDPDGKERDQSDWMMAARQKWYPLPRLKAMFPEKMRNIRSVKQVLDYTPQREELTYGTDRSERGGDYGTDDNIEYSKYIDTERRRVKVVEEWVKEYKVIYYVVDDKNTMVFKIGEDRSEAELVAARLNRIENRLQSDVRYGVLSRPEYEIYQDIFSGNMYFVEHRRSPYKHNQFPLVSFECYVEEVGDGEVETYGVVFNMEHPQDEKNKRRSMALDILNRAPKMGGFFKKGRKNADVVKKISEIGGWHEVNDPSDFQPYGGQYLGVLDSVGEMENRGDIDSEEVSGINKSMMGFMQGAKESGVLARQRVMQGTLGVQEPFEHFDMYKYRVWRMALENIRQFWSVEKILKAVGQIPGFEVDDQIVTAAELLSSDQVLEYDVRLDDGENSPSARAYAFLSMLEAQQYGIPIPPLVLVRASTWPNKEHIAQQIEQMQSDQVLMDLMRGEKGQTKNQLIKA